jgi:Fe-S-cluster containining protein
MSKPLNCKRCAAFCCKMAGQVEVSVRDIRRLAKHLELSVPQFEEKHVMKASRRGPKCIKVAYETCQFLGDNHSCTVYEARPRNCSGYVCWDQPDDTVYGFASLAQLPAGAMRRLERSAKGDK